LSLSVHVPLRDKNYLKFSGASTATLTQQRKQKEASPENIKHQNREQKKPRKETRTHKNKRRKGQEQEKVKSPNLQIIEN